jgi:acyltransferase
LSLATHTASLEAPRPPRLSALDAARALGVLAMVAGHSLDAVLSPAARATPAMIAYWKARGFTAPLFLLVSGWAVTLAISRSGARGWAVPAGRLRRVLLLLVIGYGLRFPGYNELWAGDREAWSRFLAFDALHCIGLSILVTSLVLALPWRAGVKAALLALLAVGATVLGAEALTPGMAEGARGLPASIPLMALVQVVGGTSSFPLFPWMAYFLCGTVVGLLVPGDRRGALVKAAVGIALLLVTIHWSGLGGRSAGDPVLIAYRIGVVLTVLAALSLVPARVAAWAAPLGKSSLAVYALHLPVVYGWWQFSGLSWRVGKTLGVAAGLGVAAAVLVGCFVGWRVFVAGVRRAERRVRAALAAARAAS